ncbi:hypothetical protein JTB14_031300 [Gonioctena quinquepunctata]|nr:hypothetical protein JTB14_031300 [Gonioctena quinquepunctata]
MAFLRSKSPEDLLTDIGQIEMRLEVKTEDSFSKEKRIKEERTETEPSVEYDMPELIKLVNIPEDYGSDDIYNTEESGLKEQKHFGNVKEEYHQNTSEVLFTTAGYKTGVESECDIDVKSGLGGEETNENESGPRVIGSETPLQHYSTEESESAAMVVTTTLKKSVGKKTFQYQDLKMILVLTVNLSKEFMYTRNNAGPSTVP